MPAFLGHFLEGAGGLGASPASSFPSTFQATLVPAEEAQGFLPLFTTCHLNTHGTDAGGVVSELLSREDVLPWQQQAGFITRWH